MTLITGLLAWLLALAGLGVECDPLVYDAQCEAPQMLTTGAPASEPPRLPFGVVADIDNGF